MSRNENWKPRAYRYKLPDGTEAEEIPDVAAATSERTTEMRLENAKVVPYNGPKQTIYKEFDEASVDENADIEVE